MDNTAATVATIIPTYNRAKLMVQALDSVLGQTRPPDEVVVSDDGSTDETADVVARYGNKVRYIYQENAGKAAALNRALATINVDYVWIMDDDDVALPDALERHLHFRRLHPDIDFTYSGCYCFAGDQAPPPPDECVLRQCATISPADFFVRAMEHFPCLHQTMLVPLSCYRTVGPLDESLTFSEDYDMILRLARRYRGGGLATPTIYLRLHDGARGPAQERYIAAQREEGWRIYRQKIFLKLRQELSLEEYLPQGAVQTPLTNRQIRHALAQRACIMIRQELLAEAFQDLNRVLSLLSQAAPLTQSESRVFSRMLNLELWWFQKHPEFTSDMRQLLRARECSLARQACTIGLIWSLERELRTGNYKNARIVLLQLRRLGFAGLWSIVKAVLNRLKQRQLIRSSAPTTLK